MTRLAVPRPRTVGRLAAALVSVSLLGVSGYAWATFRDVDDSVTRVELPSIGQPADGGQRFTGEDLNILLVGNDDRSTMTDAEVKALHVGRDGGSLATDTMMIVHVPADGSRATLVSLPRDTEVDVPGQGRDKLNSAYATAYTGVTDRGGTATEAKRAGADLLVRTVRALTGVRIDHYVQVDLLGFYRLAGAIGGIPVNLCRDVDDRPSTNRRTGEGGGSGFHQTKGRHVLNALESLEFVRQRHHLPNNDLDRVKRQQYFLTAAFRQVSGVGTVLKLRSLGDAVQRSVFVDGGLSLLDLAKQLDSLSANRIASHTIPTRIAGDGSLQADPAAVRRAVTGWLDPAPAPTPSTSTSTGATPAPRTSGTPSAAPSTSAPIDANCVN